MELLELKNERFSYCGKTYTQKRWIDKYGKFYIVQDELDYVKVYKANESGQCDLWYDLYYKQNHSAYPIYSLEDALKKIKLHIQEIQESEFTINIHASHFKKGLYEIYKK